jgi:uncharacterized membrane protein
MASPYRRVYVDWLRGLAVVVMIEWHAIDAWTVMDVRDGTAYALLMFIGGWAAPLFLFLAGVSVPLAGDAHLRKGLDPRAASWAVQKRGWQIFGLAHLFRLQSFLLNPTAKWSSLLKPDILNILGLGLVGAAFCWGRGQTLARRLAWLAVPAALIVVLTPASRSWWWPTLLYPRFEAYLRPKDNLGVFPLFPWVAFVFVGACVGTLLAPARSEEADVRFQRQLATGGLAVALMGAIGIFLPSPFADSSFWTTSLSWFLIRVGVMTLGLPLAWRWMRRRTAARWSPMLVFGRTSLFVYWVHVEIAYGFLTHPLQHALSLPWSISGYLVLTLIMLWLAVLWSRWQQSGRPLVPAHLIAADA